MEITEIRIKLMEGSEDRLRAFCSITIDQSFVVRDLKIIDGSHGPFVAMPSRKLTGHCNRCGSKNHLRATFCNQCGAKLQQGNGSDGPQKLYADVAHPINSECREKIQNAVVDEFQAELQRAAQPDYRSRYDDDFDAGDYDEADYSDAATLEPHKAASSPTSRSDAGVPKPQATKPQATVSRAMARRQPPQREPQRPEPPTQSPADAFGAGLFDEPLAEEPRVDSGASPDRSQPDHSQPDAIVVRGESGAPNPLPKPHFRDRPGGSGRPLVPSNPPPRQRSLTSSNEAESVDQGVPADEQDVSESAGFGAGILDD
ncbi:SpoVG family protein [Allorhodopirellula solitaria]|uniref:Putative septation protein SpoVG n=1 Tax=Allorhodopirellula solitaria TaxID=2527987 RepID=A0A5C5YJE1_9BACT|nr:SpoVG family protein [Allorhodopirellula solitaria]TWT74993.1 putative septation protein SpoVG [Allorhodopirellula solitaria]